MKKKALNQLKEQENLTINDCGLFIDKEYNFLGNIYIILLTIMYTSKNVFNN